jgi:hypothetical protein
MNQDARHYYNKGQRVQLRPHMDLWMRGARYGDVTRVTKDLVSVRLDNLPHKVRRFHPDDIAHI